MCEWFEQASDLPQTTAVLCDWQNTPTHFLSKVGPMYFDRKHT